MHAAEMAILRPTVLLLGQYSTVWAGRSANVIVAGKGDGVRCFRVAFNSLQQLGMPNSSTTPSHLEAVSAITCLPAAPGSCAGLLILLTTGSTCQARSTRSMAAKQKAAAVKQAPGVVVSFKEVKPTLSSMWIPSIKSDQASVQVPVAGSAGTPSTAETMSRIRYTGGWPLPHRLCCQQHSNSTLQQQWMSAAANFECWLRVAV